MAKKSIFLRFRSSVILRFPGLLTLDVGVEKIGQTKIIRIVSTI